MTTFDENWSFDPGSFNVLVEEPVFGPVSGQGGTNPSVEVTVVVTYFDCGVYTPRLTVRPNYNNNCTGEATGSGGVTVVCGQIHFTITPPPDAVHFDLSNPAGPPGPKTGNLVFKALVEHPDGIVPAPPTFSATLLCPAEPPVAVLPEVGVINNPAPVPVQTDSTNTTKSYDVPVNVTAGKAQFSRVRLRGEQPTGGDPLTAEADGPSSVGQTSGEARRSSISSAGQDGAR
jgi:hypothetical protein